MLTQIIKSIPLEDFINDITKFYYNFSLQGLENASKLANKDYLTPDEYKFLEQTRKDASKKVIKALLIKYGVLLTKLAINTILQIKKSKENNNVEV